jgi:hypothetical protein
MEIPIAVGHGCDESGRSAPNRSGLSQRWSHMRFLSLLTVLAFSVYFRAVPTARAQSTDTHETVGNQSWTDTSESHIDGANPTRTIQSHSQSGSRTVDSQSIQRLGSDGKFEPYQDIEKETVKVNSSTVRTITRTYGRIDGTKSLVQVTEEETRTRPGGDSSVTRTAANPDANGNLQVVQRETQETRKIGKNVEETKTTVMLQGINGGLAPAMMTEERRTQGTNDSVESQKKTLLPDGNGNWQVSEIKTAKTQGEGNDRTTEERVARPDADGKLSEVSRTVSKESTEAGEKRTTVEHYSLDVPGTPEDGGLHMVKRATTTQSTSSTGQQNTQHKVEQPDPGNPDAGLRVTVVANDSVRPGSSGARGTQTIQLLDSDGKLNVVSVDTTKSDSNHAVQVQIAPSEKPKQK